MGFRILIKLIEIKTLIAGIVPVLLGSIYSWYAYGQFNLNYFILLSIAIILIQSATNMINDYCDYKRGVDISREEDEKVLVSGEVTPKQVLPIILICELIALMIGVFIAKETSYHVLLVGITGCIISILYSSGPRPISYTPIGEVVSGVTMGIGITTTVIYVHTGIFNVDTVLVATPTALFIGTILLSNNLSDIEIDIEAGRKTLPTLIGVKISEKLWIFNVIMLLGLTFLLFVIDIYPIGVFVTVIVLFPYKSILDFLSYDKSVHTKGKTMGLIAGIGFKYHLGVILGLLVSFIFRKGVY
ncbi:prenyltransferase [Wukongibacter baidiensis]|uniref:prenyltransferase n=1 Tax=Wukongibacter baidiensis TaxID=1723361 RepID=UPI003D7F5412